MSDLEIRGLKRSELEEHAELVFRSYSHERELEPGSMLTHPDWWLRAVARDPCYEPERTRVLVMHGRLVSSLTCYSRPSYVAGRVARACCLGSVCTHPQYRRRGLLRPVLAEAAQWMMDRGVLWSVLYGLEDVYGSSGWRNMTGWTLVADIHLPVSARSDVSVRPVDPEADIGALTAIHTALNTGLTGPAQRTESTWRQRVLAPPAPWGEPRPWFMVEARNSAIGYFAGDAGNVAEVGWIDRPRDVLTAVLQQWPGEPVSLPIATPEVVDHMKGLCALPTQKECFRRRNRITLSEGYRGLWRYLHDPEGLFPEFSDTAGLIRFLRGHDYVMWPVDRT